MEKEKMLEAFKEENKAGDEREVYLRERCYAYAFRVICVLYLLIGLVEKITDIIIPIQVGFVIMSIIGIYNLFCFLWMKKKSSLILALICFIGMVGFVYYLITGSYLISL